MSSVTCSIQSICLQVPIQVTAPKTASRHQTPLNPRYSRGCCPPWRVAHLSVLVSSPIIQVGVPRPCVLCKGGERCCRYNRCSSRCANISAPTLRKVREGWATPCVIYASEIKSLGHPPV